MLKKLALDKTKDYERYLILEEMSKMLIGFVKGRSHNIAIGAEQGEIDKWDDIVIQDCNKNYIYIQVKRQTTPFSDYSASRGTYTKKDGGIALRELSSLDKTFESLALRTKESCDTDKKYRIIVPDSSILIKNEIKVRDLRRFKESIRSVTTGADLENQSKKDKNTYYIYMWLTSWCKFDDWEHIVRTFKMVELVSAGFESDIKTRTKERLLEIIDKSQIDLVISLMLTYLDDNSTYAGAITPGCLAYRLQKFFTSNIERWSLFKYEENKWRLEGLHDLSDNTEIQKPSVIVPKLWNKKMAELSSLEYYGSFNEFSRMVPNLTRLSIHSSNFVRTYCSKGDKWDGYLNKITAGTLGISNNDLDNNLFLHKEERILSDDSRKLNTITEIENYSLELSNEMNKLTLQGIDNTLQNKFMEMNKSELRDALETTWGDWCKQLSSDESEQINFFSKLLHPCAEGTGILGEVRVGIKTIELLSEAIYMLLVVCIALGKETERNWKVVKDNIKVTAIGVAYWYNPYAEGKQVVEIDDETSVDKLLENEIAEIIILSKSKLPATDLISENFADDLKEDILLSSSKMPKLLITNSILFKKCLQRGNIAEVKEYFEKQLADYNFKLERTINNAVGEKNGL